LRDFARMPNRLAAEKSPYLRQHADNPVDWFPWGDEAFAKARAEQKPIFLSIGYSTCHWCHVMAHESFENAGIAAVLNRDFVPVKLDREERSDLDRVYMTYVQQTTGHGGWPMSVWLTPDLKPFFGGTYFPPDDRHGRPGFTTVLNAITRHWSEQREKILAGADDVVAALQRHAREGGAKEVASKLAPTPPLHEAAGDAFERGYQYFLQAFDARWGGFGGAPKFPRASVISFLFRSAALQGSQSELGADAVKMAAQTLQKMAEGGLHDHVGGGFHRYSVDEQWFVPHFEKMLYDQAQIALNYLEARQATGRETHAWVARGIFDYVLRDLTGPQGGFYSAEDADSAVVGPGPSGQSKTGPTPGEPPLAGGGPAGEKAGHAEGAFYVWTKAEIERVLGADADFFCAHYGVKPGGNVAHDPHGEFTGRNILMQQQSLAVTAREFGLEIEAASTKLLGCLGTLQTERARRPRPHLDDKVITSWNGLMISALARGAQILECHPERSEGSIRTSVVGPTDGFFAGAQNDRQRESQYLAAATRAAEFIERELYDAATGTLFRSWREGRSDIEGFAEDYAYLIQGLLDLYEAGFDIHWLQWAEKLQARMDELFWDATGGGYFNSRADDPTVIVRLKDDYDGAEPAPNSVAAMNLMRLEWMIGAGTAEGEGVAGTSRGARAQQTIAVLRSQWSRVPQALPQLLCALELVLTEPHTVVLAGDPAAADFQGLAKVLHERPGLRRVILCADGAAGQRWLAARRPYLTAMHPQGRATAFVCENFACQAPVTDAAALRQMLG